MGFEKRSEVASEGIERVRIVGRMADDQLDQDKDDKTYSRQEVHPG